MAACGSSSASSTAEGSQDSTATSNENKTMTTNYNSADTSNVTVEVETTLGSFTVLLYGDTPRHRDNFVKLVKEGYYNGTLFHRVINEFMVQAGDPDSKNAAPGQQLGAGGPGYTVDAEFVFPKHFHKRGALAAARQGDQVNPTKASSGSQFYIVTGKKVSDAEMASMEQSMEQSALHSRFNQLAMAHMDEVRKMQQEGDNAGLQKLQEQLIAEAQAYVAEHPVKMTDEMKEAYKTVGGTPFLDNNYTVFGEVIKGMETVDKIEKVETDRSDRPKEDVRIISMKIVD
ncbi:MAG: peptidylprolyl isomerase [Muribaculaceae bacterium]|nr:peptidylprolyl isomerase [Muribaculaceae bacterium]